MYQVWENFRRLIEEDREKLPFIGLSGHTIMLTSLDIIGSCWIIFNNSNNWIIWQPQIVLDISNLAVPNIYICQPQSDHFRCRLSHIQVGESLESLAQGLQVEGSTVLAQGTGSPNEMGTVNHGKPLKRCRKVSIYRCFTRGFPPLSFFRSLTTPIYHC